MATKEEINQQEQWIPQQVPRTGSITVEQIFHLTDVQLEFAVGIALGGRVETIRVVC